MSRFNKYARRLDEEAKKAFEEYRKAEREYHEAEKKVNSYPKGLYGVVPQYQAEHARAQADFFEKRDAYKAAHSKFKGGSKVLSDIRSELEEAVNSVYAATLRRWMLTRWSLSEAESSMLMSIQSCWRRLRAQRTIQCADSLADMLQMQLLQELISSETMTLKHVSSELWLQKEIQATAVSILMLLTALLMYLTAAQTTQL